jgi:hypothetical protein
MYPANMTSTVLETTNDYCSMTQLLLIVLFLIWFLQHVFEFVVDPLCQGLRKRLEDSERRCDELDSANAYLTDIIGDLLAENDNTPIINPDLYEEEKEVPDAEIENAAAERISCESRKKKRSRSESVSRTPSPPPGTKQRTE